MVRNRFCFISKKNSKYIFLIGCSSEDFQKMLKSIASIQFDMKQTKNMLKEIESSITSLHQILLKHQREETEIEQSIGTLPIENMEELQLLETNLENRNYYERMVSRLFSFTC